MKSTERLTVLTQELIAYLEKAHNRFLEIKESGQEADFYKEVKPFADDVKVKNDQWRNEAVRWIAAVSPKDIHEKQIESTYKNIEMVTIQAFFPKTSRTRFIQHVQSIRYILDGILSRLE